MTRPQKLALTIVLAAMAALVVSMLSAGRANAMPAPEPEIKAVKVWKPCKYEDGSSQRRCVWDARHMGNGHGYSVKIIRGGHDNARYIRITHCRAHVLLGW